jgi:hypothetical protein
MVEKLRAATLVFSGVVVYPFDDTPEDTTLFSINDAVKGVQLRRPALRPNFPDGDPACAATFELNKNYNVFAFGTYETGYYTNACLVEFVPDPQKNDWLMEMLKLRTEMGLMYLSTQPERAQTGLELEQLRMQARDQMAMDNPELALRLFVRAAQLSGDSVVDLFGQGQAYLRLMMAQLALERFDDVLEKDNTRQDAWNGRYQALGLLNRWSELPPEKADLTGFTWRRASLSADLKSPIFAKGWWDEIDASGRSLTGADFSRTFLTNVDFTGADLSNAIFKDAELRNVNFSGANLTGSNLKGRLLGIKWDEKTRWPDGFDPKSIGQ